MTAAGKKRKPRRGVKVYEVDFGCMVYSIRSKTQARSDSGPNDIAYFTSANVRSYVFGPSVGREAAKVSIAASFEIYSCTTYRWGSSFRFVAYFA